MKVRLSDIGKEGLHIVTSREPEWLTNIPELASSEEITRLSSNINFDLRLVKILREINVYGSIQFSVESICARCLSSVDLTLSPEVKLILSPVDTPEEEMEEDVDYETYSGDEFDLGNYLREIIALSLPIKVLCREECKGLCPSCGANLNEEICSCKDDWVDPRFGILKSLKV